jgi:diaminopimelate epimerase
VHHGKEHEVLAMDPATVASEYVELARGSVNGVALDACRFAIMHGNGNVIMVVDEALSGLSGGDVSGELARALCRPFRSVRVDGVAFVRNVRNASGPVRMTYFERDGTHSQMCGNALRCVTRYCRERGYIPGEAVIATDDGDKWVSSAGGLERVSLGSGREFRKLADDRYFVFSGLPHLVVLVDDVTAVDVRTVGSALRHDERLCRMLNHPEGLHVDFMQRNLVGIRIRTYEVGVEDETLACGTGVAASAVVAHLVWGLPYPIHVTVAGGEMRVDDGEHGLLISGSTGHVFSNPHDDQ